MGVSTKETSPLPPSPLEFCTSGGIAGPGDVCGTVFGLEMGTVPRLMQVQDM